MKKDEINIKSALQGLVIDLLFWSYLWGCLYYLAHNWLGLILNYKYLIMLAMFSSGLFYLTGDSIGRKYFFPSHLTSRKWFKTLWGWLIIFSLLITFVVGWDIVEINPYKFFTKFKNAGGITSGIFDPSIIGYELQTESLEKLAEQNLPEEIIEELKKISGRKYTTRKVFSRELEKRLDPAAYDKYKQPILKSAIKNTEMLNKALTTLAETIFLALLATVLAIPLAFILSFFAARNLMPKTFLGNTIYVLIRTVATIFRSIEAIVWAIIFSVWVGIGPFAGMLALMIHSVAALTKLYSEQIENIDSGPVEAVRATGASTLQIWIFAVIPQIISPYLAFTIYRWDINVRMATIVGFVGGGGIGLLLLQQQQLLRWHNVGLIIWLIAAVVWSMDMISAKVRAKLSEM
ncbi:MAG: phosphonate ABC transporter, permease protein PhnE [Candidatus Cloacimonetes bacterium]|nr:phosphonate ABC transporter, permease protein PhnE [Candidatus Cloacimonadota bacterium]